jgi:hypothetical protein
MYAIRIIAVDPTWPAVWYCSPRPDEYFFRVTGKTGPFTRFPSEIDALAEALVALDDEKSFTYEIVRVNDHAVVTYSTDE